ncbi:hypothetical protein BKA61DRAFT_689470 [Leptodontidium sp. MPI-SDFR-AT-0119]|nr:hypothetical protein BKA61DRAFT_689470 [Leptodontidium sp. MPI-SDFR-AT-0119]
MSSFVSPLPMWMDFGVHASEHAANLEEAADPSRLIQPTLREHDHAYSVLQDLLYPERQPPQLVTLIGYNTKSQFSTLLFSLEPIESHRGILLRRIPDPGNHRIPIIVADAELHHCRSVLHEASGNGITPHPLAWNENIAHPTDLSVLAHLTYAKVLFPFSTISPTTRSRLTRVLILDDIQDPTCFDESLSMTGFIHKLRSCLSARTTNLGELGNNSISDVEFEKLLNESFFEIRILALPRNEDQIQTGQLKKLRTRILQESQNAYEFRKAAKMNISARHFKSLVHYACRHFSRSLTTPFNFVQASRIPNPVPDFEHGLVTFMGLVPPNHLDIASSIIASALRLDSFPPGAHVFELELIFNQLYSKMLSRAFNQDQQLIQDIKENFCSNTELYNTAATHRKLMHSYAYVWQDISSNTICLSCLARKPDSTLRCRHSFCETCIIIHGRIDIEERWVIDVDNCPVCDNLCRASIKLKPPTAGVRALVLDTGDHKDFDILSTFLNEAALDLELRECFDIVNGSGLGAWVAIERICKHDQFTQDMLKSQVFQRTIRGIDLPPASSKFSQFSQDFKEEFGGGLKRLNIALRSLPRWNETSQPRAALAASFASIFKKTALTESQTDGCKLCITMHSKHFGTCVLANYGLNIQPIGYERIREDKTVDKLRLSQCARMAVSQRTFRGYSFRRGMADEMIRITAAEQDSIWNRKGKHLDFLIAAGAGLPAYERYNIRMPRIFDFRLPYDKTRLLSSVDTLIASFFYVKLATLPQTDESGALFCSVQIRCRILPPSKAYQELIAKLRVRRARFYFDFQSVPCVNKEILDESERNIPFTRCVNLSIQSYPPVLDVQIHGITKARTSISNCPYDVQQLVEDQGLNCVFGHWDHKERYFG